MRCVHINIRKATFLLLSFLANFIQTEDNAIKDQDNAIVKNLTNNVEEDKISTYDLVLHCPMNMECLDLSEPCIKCDLNTTCKYGEKQEVTCRIKPQINCRGEKMFKRNFTCRYCYQTEHWEHSCELMANCNSISSPSASYVTNCTVKDDILCLGHRMFRKKVKCNWTGGYRWSTALALSITLGGFGADRFYLGHWQEGIGKLFSFGGLGVWTIIDVILISLHYLGPADGSLYI